MIKKLSVLPFLFAIHGLHAQTIKTDVLVIGNGPSAVAAAIQSARSKVKTVLAIEGINIETNDQNLTITENLRIPSGIWGEFRNHVKDFYKTTPGFDTTFKISLHLAKTDGEVILKKMADTVKKLTIEWNTAFASVEKSGDEWEVKVLKDGKTEEIKTRIIVDATEMGVIAEKAGGKSINKIELRQTTAVSDLRRTAIASGETSPQGSEENKLYDYWCIPLKTIVLPGAENLFITQAFLPLKKDANDLPIKLELGQGAGVAAAFCAFFKTNTTHLNVRTIQGELLDFKVDLAPFVDITHSDIDWRKIQQVALTGLIPGSFFMFSPDQPITSAEIKPVLTEIYTRAFLWFNKERPGEKFTVANMLSFISDYTLTDPAILKSNIQKAWKTQFKFQLDFDLNRPITRREFAVLANKYLNPFARTVNIDGRLIN